MTIWELIKDRPGMPEDMKVCLEPQFLRGFNTAIAQYNSFLKGAEVEWPEYHIEHCPAYDNLPCLCGADHSTQVLKVKEGEI